MANRYVRSWPQFILAFGLIAAFPAIALLADVYPLTTRRVWLDVMQNVSLVLDWSINTYTVGAGVFIFYLFAVGAVLFCVKVVVDTLRGQFS